MWLNYSEMHCINHPTPGIFNMYVRLRYSNWLFSALCNNSIWWANLHYRRTIHMAFATIIAFCLCRSFICCSFISSWALRQFGSISKQIQCDEHTRSRSAPHILICSCWVCYAMNRSKEHMHRSGLCVPLLLPVWIQRLRLMYMLRNVLALRYYNYASFFFLLCVCAHSTQRERERDAHILAQNNSDCERSTHGVVLLVTDHVCSEHTQTRTHTGRLEFYRVSPHSATAANNIKKTRYECF